MMNYHMIIVLYVHKYQLLNITKISN
ncbi:hypothetical protein ACQ27_gp094 [Klebsiella phage K64-1]|nr:hypothetical protein ACQ27_gp094 [Klebsiella phage K64-1]